MADMPPNRPLVPKRSHSPEPGGSWPKKHSKAERSEEASSPAVWPPQKELASKCNDESGDETSYARLESDYSLPDPVLDDPPGELEKALAPLKSALPVEFSHLLPTMSRLMTLISSDYLIDLVGQQDVDLFNTVMTNVGKAFVGLSEISPYVKATYEDRYNIFKEMKRTKAKLETAESNLRKKRKAVRRLQLQIQELRERHVLELKNGETRAVEAFKESAEYAKILEDEHQQGIEECRYHIEQRRPHWDLSFLDIP